MKNLIIFLIIIALLFLCRKDIGRLLNKKQVKPTQPKEETPIEEVEPIEESPKKEIVFINEKPLEIWDDPIILESDPEDTLDVYTIEIVDDGGDLTTQILEQLLAVPDGTVKRPNIIKLPKGKFWTEGDLDNNWKGTNSVFKIVNKHNWIIEGYSIREYTEFYTKAPAVPFESKVQKNEQSERRHFLFLNCSNIKTRYIHVSGSNKIEGHKLGSEGNTPDFWKGGSDQGALIGFAGYKDCWEAEHGFAFYDCEYMLLEYAKISSVWGDGTYCGHTLPLGTNHVTIRNVEVTMCGRQAHAASMAHNLLYENCTGEGNRRAFFDFEPHADWLIVKNVKVRHCKMNPMQTIIAAVGNGDVSNVLIEDNIWSGGHSVICYDSQYWNPTRRSNWIIRRNKRTDWFGSPIAAYRFQFMDNILIEEEHAQVDGWQSKISADFEYCDNVEVRNNAFGGGERIRLVETTNINITNNTPKQETFESIADYNR